VVVAAAIAFASYLYSSYNSDLLNQDATKVIDRTARIQTQDLSKILENKISDLRNNLFLISKSNPVQQQDVEGAGTILANGQESTKDFTDSYFWVDKDGKLLWANSFSDEAVYRQYAGADRSDRTYYSGPKESHSFHVSNVIASVDDVPRLYFSYPILSEDGSDTFKGVAVASANLPGVGEYLKSQLSSETPNSVSLMSKDGIILYSQNVTLIGLDYYGKEIQSRLPEDLKQPLNAAIDKSLQNSGLGQVSYSYQENSGSITYVPIIVDGASVGVLYIVAPYGISGEAQQVLDSQRNFTIFFIAALAGVAIAAAIAVLKWNERLRKVVAKRTGELQDSNFNLNRALEQLKIHDRMQKEFINVAAHELRTPVQPILSMAEIAEMDNKNSEAGLEKEVKMSREDFEMILRNARRLEHLSSDILEVARIESQSLQLRVETFDLNEKIQAVIRDIKTLGSEGKDIDIVFNPTNDPIPVNADVTKVFEVVSNLIRNAVKFTPANGRITITAKKAENEVIVSVNDTGSGIDAEIMPKLFTKFATKSFTGTGLGLYISRAIVESHGGKIWAENNSDGRGATFSFTLKPQKNDNKAEEIAPIGSKKI
jgi:signal transduction histidine kinase